MKLIGIIIFVGNYGSGKSEVSINFALDRKKKGLDVRIADLDLVNPYFRSREAKEMLQEKGIQVVLPPDQYHHADLPILSPRVGGLIRNPGDIAILDAGGDDVGATVLASLGDALSGRTYTMLQVVNPNRPFTETIEGCGHVRKMIEKSSKLKVTGIAGNANLMDDTTVEMIYKGYDFVRRFQEKSGLPLAFITAEERLYPKLNLEEFECPVLPLRRTLTPPWRHMDG